MTRSYRHGRVIQQPCGYRKSHPSWRPPVARLISWPNVQDAHAVRGVARVDASVTRLARRRDPLSAAATACLETLSTAKVQTEEHRQTDLRLALPAVPVAGRCRNHLQTGDAGALASWWLSPVQRIQVEAKEKPVRAASVSRQSTVDWTKRRSRLGYCAHPRRCAAAERLTHLPIGEYGGRWPACAAAVWEGQCGAKIRGPRPRADARR
jgi:hypothetical protein